jgi:DNA (cytosine-5)-methyltransferase 1
MAEGEKPFSSVEICAGAGGQAIGLERAGFAHLALVEIDPHACATLRANFPGYEVHEGDVRSFLAAVEHDKSAYDGLDLLAGGVPCPPFSLAGKQLGEEDERDLFPVMVKLAGVLQPKAVMIENVRGLLQAKFDQYREKICAWLEELGYVPMLWDQFNASEFGVPQLRPRSILVALRKEFTPYYTPPRPDRERSVSVGEVLERSMRQRGMRAAEARKWAARACEVAPTLVGGSKKHGGADLGPTRAKKQWELMGVDAHGVADDSEPATLVGPNGRGPRLTVAQAAMLQGFPADWKFQGGKTARYRQVGNAFPPPVAEAVARQIRAALVAAAQGAPIPESAKAERLQLPAQRTAPRRTRQRRPARDSGQLTIPA